MSDYVPVQTGTLVCGGCNFPMKRGHNAKWREHDYYCPECNCGFRYVGIWDYDKED